MHFLILTEITPDATTFLKIPTNLYVVHTEQSVYPAKFRHQLIHFVSNAELLHDVSVSRPKERVHWGIPVPDAPHQTIYVWLDALVSYITAARSHCWPPDLQVVGKDILK